MNQFVSADYILLQNFQKVASLWLAYSSFILNAHTAYYSVTPQTVYRIGKEQQINVCLSWAKAWFCASGCMDSSVGRGGGGGSIMAGNPCGDKKQWEGERGRSFLPLVAFTTHAQIIKGHGNLSDRWTMLPFSSPLWTGPSITGGEINSIHQLFVSVGPLMPPYSSRGAYKCLWTWSEVACLTLN